jgi:hypothetical protein
MATSTKASQQATPAPRLGGLIFDPVTQMSNHATDHKQDDMRDSTDAGQEGERGAHGGAIDGGSLRDAAEGPDDAVAADAIRVLVEKFRAHEETSHARDVVIRAREETIRARDVEIRALQEENRALKKRKIGEA